MKPAAGPPLLEAGGGEIRSPLRLTSDRLAAGEAERLHRSLARRR